MSPTEIFYVLIGLASIGLIFFLNRPLFGARRIGVSAAEAVYYLVGLAALVIGWYFNFQYFRQYGADVGWLHWTKLLFVNPASASGGQDLIIANLILFPLWTILDGRRQGMRASWLYFPASLLTSFAFGMALFLALQDRQRRWNEHRMSATVVAPAGA
jgi:uncharacterized membrane protein YuzA (DUF378 family)